MIPVIAHYAASYEATTSLSSPPAEKVVAHVVVGCLLVGPGHHEGEILLLGFFDLGPDLARGRVHRITGQPCSGAGQEVLGITF